MQSGKAVSKIDAVNGVKMRSVKNKQRDGKSETEEGNEDVCKKRILMGGKCKPLNVSGVFIMIKTVFSYQKMFHRVCSYIFLSS